MIGSNSGGTSKSSPSWSKNSSAKNGWDKYPSNPTGGRTVGRWGEGGYKRRGGATERVFIKIKREGGSKN